jgi:hypothetical protein
MTLKEILKRLDDMEAEASVDLASVSYETRVGAEGRVRAAQAELQLLKRQYLDAVMPTLLLVAVTGPGSERFGTIATDKFSTIALNYQALADRIYRTLKERRAGDLYGQNEHWMVLTSLNQLKNELNITQMHPPTLTALDSYFSQPLKEGIKQMLTKTYGPTLNSIVLRKSIGEAALANRFAGTFLPVVLYNYNETGVDPQHLPNPIATIEVGDDVTEELVRAELTRINNALKRSRRKASEAKDLNNQEQM